MISQTDVLKIFRTRLKKTDFFRQAPQVVL
jgi:hypothetical protein